MNLEFGATERVTAAPRFSQLLARPAECLCVPLANSTDVVGLTGTTGGRKVHLRLKFAFQAFLDLAASISEFRRMPCAINACRVGARDWDVSDACRSTSKCDCHFGHGERFRAVMCSRSLHARRRAGGKIRPCQRLQGRRIERHSPSAK